MDPTNVQFNAPLPGDPKQRNGLIVTMDNENLGCSAKATYSAGHLSGIQTYGYGHFEFEVKAAHALDGTQANINAFSCLSLYAGTSTASQHNEIAFCWNRKTPSNVNFSYWVGWDQD